MYFQIKIDDGSPSTYNFYPEENNPYYEDILNDIKLWLINAGHKENDLKNLSSNELYDMLVEEQREQILKKSIENHMSSSKMFLSQMVRGDNMNNFSEKFHLYHRFFPERMFKLFVSCFYKGAFNELKKINEETQQKADMVKFVIDFLVNEFLSKGGNMLIAENFNDKVTHFLRKKYPYFKKSFTHKAFRSDHPYDSEKAQIAENMKRAQNNAASPSIAEIHNLTRNIMSVSFGANDSVEYISDNIGYIEKQESRIADIMESGIDPALIKDHIASICDYEVKYLSNLKSDYYKEICNSKKVIRDYLVESLGGKPKYSTTTTNKSLTEVVNSLLNQ